MGDTKDMLNKFNWCYFSDCNINDEFFDSLKSDYEEFTEGFDRKAKENTKAFVYKENSAIKAFVYLKREDDETLGLTDRTLPEEPRIKIGTLKISDSSQGMRLGEGAIGVSLWYWQKSNYNQIYITVFEKHDKLISMLLQFGFECIGQNKRGENIYLKDKRKLSFENGYTSFPYINPNIKRCGYIPINDTYHDTLFPYSELYGTNQETEEIAAANGITKVFLAASFSKLDYKTNEPVLIYRKYTGEGIAKYKSVVSSFCTVHKQIIVRKNNCSLISKDEFLNIVGNKTVFSVEELDEWYKKKNLAVIVLIYNGYFGKGKNINYATLKENGLFESYPYVNKLSKSQFEQVLKLGGKNVQNIIID